MTQRIARMTRRSFIASMAGAGLALSGCGSNADEGDDSAGVSDAAQINAEDAVEGLAGTCAIHVQGYDWGAGVDKVTVTLESPIDAIAARDLTVTEVKQDTDWTAADTPVIQAAYEREVVAAYLVDDQGRKTSRPSDTFVMELTCSPTEGSPILYAGTSRRNLWSNPYQLLISLAEDVILTSKGEDVEALAIDPEPTERTTSADAWSIDSHTTSDGTVYPYAAYDPPRECGTLVVWLHASAEGRAGGSNAQIPILASKVVALSEDEFQDTVGGAHILVPQCPTMWMDVYGDYTYIKASNSDYVNSFYTSSLEEFIDYRAEIVGANKVVLVGASNGGFMVMNLAINRPQRYAGIVPICEAVPSVLITDAQIESLRDLPMYFVWSEDDTVVEPQACELPTIDRLRAAGKTDETLHYSTTDHVIDTSGEYFDDEGNPYQYKGHWSWIYFHNNECSCNEDGLKAFDFIAQCVRPPEPVEDETQAERDASL